MKNRIKKVSVVLFFIVFTMAFAVGFAPANAQAATKKQPSLKATKATVYYNVSGKNTVQIVPKGNSYKLKSTSYSVPAQYKNYISVSKKGVVTGKKKGTAYVNCKMTYYYKGKKTKAVTQKFNVNVAEKYVAVTGIRIMSQKALYVGHTYTLKTTIVPANATNQNIIWKSSDTSVATVSGNGVVKGIGLGKAKITATTKDGNYSSTCTFTVKADAKYPVVDSDGNTHIGLQAYTQAAFTVKGGTSVEMDGNSKYSCTDETYFESSNENVIGIKYAYGRCLANGKITNGVRIPADEVYAVKSGTAVLTVRRSKDNSIVGKYTVTVTSTDPYYTWRQKILAQHTNGGMTKLEKLTAIVKWLAAQSYYPHASQGIPGSKYGYTEPGAWEEIENGNYGYTCLFVGIMYDFCTDLDVYSYITQIPYNANVSNPGHKYLHLETNGAVYHCELQGGYGEIYKAEVTADGVTVPCECYLDENIDPFSSEVINSYVYHDNNRLIESEIDKFLFD